MKKTFNQLKRDLKESTGKTLKVLYHFRGEEKPELLQDRTIKRVQTNALTTTRDGNEKECWLYYPNGAELVEYNDNTFSFYEAGERDLTETEKRHLEAMNNLCTKEEIEMDIYTDTNIEYWKKKAYAKENNIEYLLGFEEKQGKKYNWNSKRVRDNKVRGALLYTFEIVK